jgi:hypothetical protein
MENLSHVLFHRKLHEISNECSDTDLKEHVYDLLCKQELDFTAAYSLLESNNASLEDKQDLLSIVRYACLYNTKARLKGSIAPDQSVHLHLYIGINENDEQVLCYQVIHTMQEMALHAEHFKVQALAKELPEYLLQLGVSRSITEQLVDSIKTITLQTADLCLLKLPKGCFPTWKKQHSL